MRILLTGANGYIGKRLLQELHQQGHQIICCVRDKRRFDISKYKQNVEVVEIDFENISLNAKLSFKVEVVYYLIHSMGKSIGRFSSIEAKTAHNFIKYVKSTGVKQIIYLSGIINSESLSEHLTSRKNVEDILKSSEIPVTTLRAGIIIGSGSASFEIIRDLVEKLPIMITPKWLNTRSQPIAVKNVIQYLIGIMNNKSTFNKSYDIGGPEVLTYKTMLLKFAEVRSLKRLIITLPVMTPRLSSYWLYFVTATSYKLAVNLVNSMKVEVIANKNNLANELGIKLIDFKSAVKDSFSTITQNMVVSSWKDALITSNNPDILNYIQVPSFGCFIDKRKAIVTGRSEEIVDKIWKIGGDNGWYFANYLWQIRGFIDKIFGGVGLRRGRTNQKNIYTGDVLDFWRVLMANKKDKRLLLFAEMKLPGEAWLELKIENIENNEIFVQKATFRPRGLTGRLYWYLLWPFHFLIFNGMLKKIVGKNKDMIY